MRRSIYVVFGVAFLAALLGGCGGGGHNGNEGILSFTSSGYTVNEDGTLGTAITIHREGGTVAIDVTVVMTDGTATAPSDYDASPILVSWAAGDLTDKVIAVPIVNDHNDEPDEFFTMTLTNPTNGAVLGVQDTATDTIIDDDVAGTVQFSSPTYFYDEDGTVVGMDITVTRVGGIDGDITVGLSPTDGTANSDPNSVVEPVDYNPTSFTPNPAFFADQDATPVTITFSIVNDSLPELDEDFTLSLVNPTNGATLGSPSACVVTIVDDDNLFEIDNPTGELNGLFGTTIAKIGQRLAIGAPANSSPEGRVYSYNVDFGSLWDTFNGGPNSQQFGWSLASGGDTLAIGGHGNAWSFGGDLFLTDYSQRFMVTSADAGFAGPILVANGSIYIGAPLAQIGGALTPSGRVSIWDAVFGTPHPSIDGVADNQFGSALTTLGSDLLVGADGNTGSVLRYGGSPLALTFTIPNPFPQSPSPAFGASLATMGGTIVVGSPDADTFATNDGRVYLLNGGAPVTILAPGPIVPSGRFGANILVISGNRICVQQPGGAGGVGRVFVLDSAGNLLQTIDDPVPSPGANFGASMCEFDGALAIGAPKNPFLLQSGSIFIFKLL